MNKILIIDWCMLVAFIATAITGCVTHIVGHSSSHWLWEICCGIHVLSAICFITAGVMHIKTHWAWYKGWFSTGLGKKSRVTAILSAIYLLALTSGIVLLFINGVNSHFGLLHYKIGIILTLIGLGHIVKRHTILRKSLKR